MRRIFLWGLVLCLLPCRPGWADKTCSEEALYRVGKAGDCLNHHDPGCAKLQLEGVLEREPNCADAVFISGWILENYESQPEAGRDLQNRALKLDPKLSDFWDKRAHRIESQLTSQQFSHFDVQFDGAEDRGKAWDAVTYLNEVFNELSSLFGVSPTQRIPVIVFTTDEFMDAWRAPFIGGFFDKRDGKVRIRVDDIPGGDAEFRHRARHEFTHAFIRHIYAPDLPSWVSEGIAEFYAQSSGSGVFWKEDRLEAIRKLIRKKPWLTLTDIQEAISKKRVSPYVIQRAYMESEALVIYVAQERGDSWIPNVIRYLRDHGGTFEAAFEAVLGTSPDAVLERLRHSWE